MLDILFKQLGFNPADIKKQVDDAAGNFNKVINHFNERFDKQDEILNQLLLKHNEIINQPERLSYDEGK